MNKILLASILIAATFNGFAQQRQQAIKPIRLEVAAKAPEVPVLKTGKISNVSKARHETAMNTIRNMKAVAAPKPLPSAQLKALLSPGKPSGGPNTQLKASPKPVLTKLKLSPRNNFHGFGYLEFNEVRHLFAKEDQVLFYGATDPSMAFVHANIKVEKGARYLVDWAVTVSRQTVFSVGAGGSHQLSMGDGGHHLLTYLDSDMDGWTTIGLHTDTADYRFHSLEVTKVE